MKSSKLRQILFVISGAMVLFFVMNVSFRDVFREEKFSFHTHPVFAQWFSTNELTSIADIAERVLPSVVNISSTRQIDSGGSIFENHPFFRDFFHHREPPRQQAQGLGSGVIVTTDGLVLTNNHVVDKADEIKVVLSDNRKFDAKILGKDPKSDLAVLRLKGAKNLRPLPLGDSSKLRLGDIVLAVGNPFGVGQTVTMGIVSAKGRANMGIVDYEDFIQTDAAINPGNSGGALVNMKGQLVGINTAILSRTGGYQGIGFAIPTNMAKPIMNSLIKTGKVIRGWLGVSIQEVTQELAKALKLSTTEGVLISDVDPLGPGKKAGLKRGDLVVKVNGNKVTSPGNLRNSIASAGANQLVTLELIRDGKPLSLSVRLAELPLYLGGTAGSVENESAGSGLVVGPLTPSLRNQYNIPQRLKIGVVIKSVKPNSSAGQAGLQKGDVILEVNRARIDSVKQFSQLYAAARGEVLLLVYRQGSTFYLILPK